MKESTAQYREEEIAAPVSVSHLVRVLNAYSMAITVSLAAVAIAYAIIALALYIIAPSTRVISQPFRLDFSRAAEGKYPNGLKFSSNDLISTPILTKAYKDSDLKQYISLSDFVAGVYVLESGTEFERLQREYQAKLNDPKLNSADRVQIEKDYSEKVQSLPRNFYTLNFAAPSGTKRVPEALARQAVLRILSRWADWAQNEGRITSYDVAVLSPSILDEFVVDNEVITIRMLIKKLSQVLDNLDEIAALPSASLVRTPRADHLSLAELRIKIEDLIRFRLEPAVPLARESRRNGDPVTLRFVQTQLEYDQRQLQGAQDRVDAIKNALNIYTNQRTVSVEPSSTAPPAGQQRGANQNPTETVMPQVSDTFIDRMAQLLNQSADVQFRQSMVKDLRRVQMDLIPIQEAVRYDQQLLKDVSIPSPNGASAYDVRGDVEKVRAEAKQFVAQVNEIFVVITSNLNPQTYFYTLTSPSTSTLVRSTSLGRLALIGMLTLLVAFPIIVAFCLIHNRIREEELAVTATHSEVTAS